MQAYLEFGRISVTIPMSFVCSSIATPNTDDDLPSAFFNAGQALPIQVGAVAFHCARAPGMA